MNGFIKLQDLVLLCFNTRIVIKRADNGKVVIDGVHALKRSEDKRQMAKWDAFRNKEVFAIHPSIKTEGMKRGDSYFEMVIEAFIRKEECENAIAEFKSKLKDGE